MESAPFRFDEATHEYSDQHGRILNITSLLLLSGWTDDRWYTDEGRDRGHEVHKLTADYDLGALKLDDVEGTLRGYVLAHASMMHRLAADLWHIEVAAVHPHLRFAGRCDRVGRFLGFAGVLDVKTGQKHKSHKIQTAMQAILAAPTIHLSPYDVARWTGYIRPNGRFIVEPWTDRGDVDEAYRIIDRFCRPGSLGC
jgi:hypothetical protein